MQKSLYFYNTLGRKLEKFVPINQEQVAVYSCGPTVYSTAHIGNMRAYVFADILNKTLKDAGFNVKHVMNITDVGHLVGDGNDGEDKMLVGMRREQLTAFQVAQKYTEIFLKDIKTLNIDFVDIVCKATDYIKEQIDLVKALEEKGFTYITSDGVYFDTSKLEDYGKLALLDIEGLRGGERIDLGEKKTKTDFALWKFSPKDEKRDMEWASPWGIGFPGWAIECSAMAMKHLGETIDIHTGSIDHIPVHHTNEIAQSESATGKKFANFWLHNDHVVLKDSKMSKSKGSIVSVETLVEKVIDPLALRYLCLMSHYRKKIVYTENLIRDAETAYLRLNAKVIKINNAIENNSDLTDSYNNKVDSIIETLYKDLNTAGALGEFRIALSDDRLSNFEKSELVKRFDKIFGLSLGTEKAKAEEEIPAEILELAKQRKEYRANKNWENADKVRDKLKAKGYEIKDTADGIKVTKI
ncbi:MAG: cysteine--tRNA ligase [Proteobacteria bacterium]|nr:cysteine--tRNA ligase [Pseudomonadota bacterium]